MIQILNIDTNKFKNITDLGCMTTFEHHIVSAIPDWLPSDFNCKYFVQFGGVETLPNDPFKYDYTSFFL